MACEFNKIFSELSPKKENEYKYIAIGKVAKLAPFTVEIDGEQYSSKGFKFHEIDRKYKYKTDCQCSSGGVCK